MKKFGNRNARQKVNAVVLNVNRLVMAAGLCYAFRPQMICHNITDITALMLQYRACCLAIWNDHCQALPAPVNHWDRLDAFDDITVKLFNMMVLSNVDNILDIDKSPSYMENLNVLPELRVRINAPVAIARSKEHSPWDHPVTVVDDEQTDFRFVDFFDFNRQGLLRFEFYRVRIVSSIDHPEVIGHDALLNVEDCRVEARVPRAT